MKPIGPYVVCKADLEQKKKHLIPGTDIELYIETDYEQNYRIKNPNYATVVYVPDGDAYEDWDKRRHSQILKPGDLICSQHFQLINDRNESQSFYKEGDEDLFRVDVREVYFKVVDGIPVMLGNNALCELIEPPLQTEGGIEIPESLREQFQREMRRAKIAFLPERHEGLEIGDVIVFIEFADYELEFDGKKYLKIATSEMLAIIPAV